MTSQLHCEEQGEGQWPALCAAGIPGRADGEPSGESRGPAFPTDPSRNPAPWNPLVVMYDDDDDESDEDDVFGDDEDYEDEDYEDEDEFAEDDEEAVEGDGEDDDEEEEETF